MHLRAAPPSGTPIARRRRRAGSAPALGCRRHAGQGRLTRVSSRERAFLGDTDATARFGFITDPTPANGAATPLAPDVRAGPRPHEPARRDPGALGRARGRGRHLRPGPAKSGEIDFDGASAVDGTASRASPTARGSADRARRRDGQALRVSGVRVRLGANPETTYDRDLPVFDLDLGGRDVHAATGSPASSRGSPPPTTPSLPTTPRAPARTATPNTFGSFTITFGRDAGRRPPTTGLDPAGAASPSPATGFKTTRQRGCTSSSGRSTRRSPTDTRRQPVGSRPGRAGRASTPTARSRRRWRVEGARAAPARARSTARRSPCARPDRSPRTSTPTRRSGPRSP